MKSTIETMKATLVGVAPLLMSNGQLADPTNEIARRIKEVKGKGSRKMTDDDYERVAELMYHGSIYCNGKGPFIPGLNIENMLINASPKYKRGIKGDIKAGVLHEGDPYLKYTGPKTAESLWSDGGFMRRALVPGSNGRSLVAYPMFREWSLQIELTFFSDIISRADLKGILVLAGRQIGLGAWRPRHGRFSVEFAK